MQIKTKSQLIDSAGLKRTISRLSHELLERHLGLDKVVMVGMQTRGVFLARRIAQKLSEIEGSTVPCGVLDVSFYRDDYRMQLKQPDVKVSNIPFSIDERHIILVDDVLYTGRTIRAALDALMDFGRPASIQLVALIDRGHRELPIRVDFVGKNIPTSQGEEVRVLMTETDAEDGVYLVDVTNDKSS